MLDGNMLDKEVAYLDSMHYGCMYEPKKLFEQVERFSGNHAPSFQWNKSYRQALKFIAEQYAPTEKLKVLDFRTDCEIEDALPRKDTHSGWTFVVTGKRDKGENIEGAADELRIRIIQAIADGSFNVVIMPGKRLQVSGAYADDGSRTGEFKRKTRLVSMVDFYLILAELKYSKGVQSHFAELDIYAGGKNPIELHNLVNRKRTSGNYWTSVDYSSYDQSIPNWLIYDAFKILYDWFGDMNTLDAALWKVVVNDFVNKSFISKGGELIRAHHGVPSGSMFTQIIDTLCNQIMISTYFLSKNRTDYECLICGDDNLITTSRQLDESDMLNYLKHNFGVQGHPDKCKKGVQSVSPEFLSRTWMWSSVWREPKLLLAKMLYPERFRPYSKGEIFPELILYSYIQAYPTGMREMMDVDQFYRDYPKLSNCNLLPAMSFIPGYLSYQLKYENTNTLVG
jgi:hypothetical protein